jgi:hypothetical protein
MLELVEILLLFTYRIAPLFLRNDRKSLFPASSIRGLRLCVKIKWGPSTCLFACLPTSRETGRGGGASLDKGLFVLHGKDVIFIKHNIILIPAEIDKL